MTQGRISSTSRPALDARRPRSSRSSVMISSPSFASATRAASTTSDIPANAMSSPALRPRDSSSGRTSIPDNAVASRACLEPPRQTWPTTPPCVTGRSPAECNPFSLTHIERSLRSIAIRAPASKIVVTQTESSLLASSWACPIALARRCAHLEQQRRPGGRLAVAGGSPQA